jgi:hypothetical protein
VQPTSQNHPTPPNTPGSDAVTALIAATCVMVILTPVLIWLFS